MIKNIFAVIGVGTVLYGTSKLFQLLVDARVKYELDQVRRHNAT